jgi:ATP-dependent helicase/nuclease subunit A
VVNALFLDVPEFAPFRAQTSFAGNQPGRVELLPLCGKSEEEETPLRDVLRDPLTEPDVEPEDLRLRQEADCLAAKISEMLGHSGNSWQIKEKGIDGQFSQRAVRYGDIMLLVRTRTNLACYERALTAAKIPFDAGSRGGLLAALEVRDIVALLEFLVTPVADLKLAQT